MKTGLNCIIGENANIGKNVEFANNVIVEDYAVIGDNTFIDNNCIIRSDACIGNNSFISSNCIIGEYLMDYCIDRKKHDHKLTIGENALIRSGTIIYAGSTIGKGFMTGHNVTIREKTVIGNHVSVGTLSDIQGNCKIGNYVRMHSNVHVGQLSQIDDFCWIFPYVVFTNDPTPPSENLKGVHVFPFAIVATSSTILPGVNIGQDALVAAGSTVVSDVKPYSVVAGTPSKSIGDVRKIRNKETGEFVYPWRRYFKKYMPWEETDFDSWYKALSIDDISDYNLEGFIN